MLTDFVVAAAAAFCAMHGEHPACAPKRAAPVAISADDVAALRGYVATMARAPYVDDPAFAWRDIGADEPGDCDDRMLWLAETLARARPHIWAAARPVLWFQRDDEGQPMRVAHVALFVWTQTQVLRLDAAEGELRAFTLDNFAEIAPQLYVAPDGVGGRWMRLIDEHG